MKTPLPAFSHRTIFDTAQSSHSMIQGRLQTNNANGNMNSFLDELGKGKTGGKSDAMKEQLNPLQTPNLRKSDSGQHEKNAARFNLDQETYDLQLMSVSHLSYDKVGYFKAHPISGEPMPAAQKVESILPKDQESNFTIKSLQPGQNKSVALLGLFKKHDLLLEDQFKESFQFNKNTAGNEAVFLKKVVSITDSELFVRNFFDDSSKMIEEIKRQLPDGIGRIWLNGKIVWVKDI